MSITAPTDTHEPTGPPAVPTSARSRAGARIAWLAAVLGTICWVPAVAPPPAALRPR